MAIRPRLVSLLAPPEFKAMLVEAANRNGLSVNSEAINMLCIAYGLGQQLNPRRHKRVPASPEGPYLCLPLPPILYKLVKSNAGRNGRSVSAEIRQTLKHAYGRGDDGDSG